MAGPELVAVAGWRAGPQVFSLTSPGLWNLGEADGIALQHACKDRLAEAVRAHPDRMQGFATLAAHSPEAATAGLQLLRLVMAGIFDRFPGLQVILGRWGRDDHLPTYLPTYLAGSESAMDAFISDVTPERVAQRLRELAP